MLEKFNFPKSFLVLLDLNVNSDLCTPLSTFILIHDCTLQHVNQQCAAVCSSVLSEQTCFIVFHHLCSH